MATWLDVQRSCLPGMVILGNIGFWGKLLHQRYGRLSDTPRSLV